MNRTPLLPALVFAVGLLAGTLLAKLGGGSVLLAILGAVVLAAALLAAARLRTVEAPSRGAMLDAAILAGAIVIAGAMLAAKDPGRVGELLPTIGAAASLPVILMRPGTGRRSCA